MTKQEKQTIIPTIESTQPLDKIKAAAKDNGKVIIVENGIPKFLMFDVEDIAAANISDDDKIDVAAIKILNQHRAAFEELAK